MGRAKDIILRPISARDANRVVQSLHYSGKVAPNSQVHFGVFLDGRCGGALSFGPSLRRKLMANLVEGTRSRQCIELNRMAMAEWLPRNGESRALSVAMRLLRRSYPHLKWVVTFADGCQCGDGTIYRAAGFILTDIRENTELRKDPKTGQILHTMQAYHLDRLAEFKREWTPLPGVHLRYLYFLDPSWRARLTVPEIPYSRIAELGASMYRGQRVDQDTDAQ
jgi:hypothetical protein